MSAVQLIALASTVSLLAGWRLYFVTFVVGLAMRFGWLAMPNQLQAMDVLANIWIIGIAAVGAVAEFFADKIPWVDSAWDAVHTFVRPLGGALLSVAIINPSDPAWQVGALLRRRSSPGWRTPISDWRRNAVRLSCAGTNGSNPPTLLLTSSFPLQAESGRGTNPLRGIGAGDEVDERTHAYHRIEQRQ